MDLPQYIYWNHANNMTILVIFFIAIVLFTLLRVFSGVISHMSSFDELVKHDNPAFGVSLAGVTFAVTVIIMGTLHSNSIETVAQAITYVGIYGLAGIVLMAATRLFFDSVILPQISIRDEIQRGNMAAAILDAGNVIATAIVLYSVMTWVELDMLNGILVVVIAYVVSQLLLSLITLLRVRRFKRKNDGTSLEGVIERGNVALALRFSGYRIGTAFAIASGYYILAYDMQESLLTILLVWTLVALLLVAVLSVLDWVANRIIFWNVPTESEVITQGNVAIGALQMTIYIGLGMLFVGVFANGVMP